MCIVDLAFVLIDDAVGLVSKVRLMISRLCQDHDLSVLSPVPPTLMHILLVISSALTNYYTARVPRVCKVNGVTVLVNCDNRASTQIGIKAGLALYFRLHL